MNISNLIRNIINERKGSISEISAAQSSIPELRASAMAQRDALIAEHDRKLATSSDQEIAESDASIATIEREIARLDAQSDALAKIMTEARESAAAEEFKRLDKEARAACSAAEQALLTDYPKGARLIVSAISLSEKANVAVAKRNAAAPADEAVLFGPERRVRNFDTTPKEEVSREVVHLWCHEDSWSPIPDELQKSVSRLSDNLGTLPPVGWGSSSRVECRPFWKVKYFAADNPIFVSLSGDVRLPGVRRGDPDFYIAGSSAAYPEQILATIEASATKTARATIERRPSVEFVPIREPLAAAGAAG